MDGQDNGKRDSGFNEIRNMIWHFENDPVNTRSSLAADFVTGGADGNVYASFVGLPAESGTGSSFSLFDSMAIAAASEAKEGAWAFIRTLLLPEGNTVRWDEAYYLPSVNGFAMNRETLETQLECTYWLNTESWMRLAVSSRVLSPAK